MLALLATAPLWVLALAFVLENLVIFALAVSVGDALVRRNERRRVTPSPPPLVFREIAWCAATVAFNSAVTFAGVLLWRRGLIVFRDDLGPGVIVDVVVLLLAMDVAMYFLHRLAHLRWILPWMHQTHHDFDRPRPLDLFVLNPFECVGFGSLWLCLIAVYDASWLGMSIYLALNVAFGTLGHLGVEVFPVWWTRTPGLRHITTSTFHAQHHAEADYNYGFYTTVWDRLFGTLHPQYERVASRTIPSSAT